MTSYVENELEDISSESENEGESGNTSMVLPKRGVAQTPASQAELILGNEYHKHLPRTVVRSLLIITYTHNAPDIQMIICATDQC